MTEYEYEVTQYKGEDLLPSKRVIIKANSLNEANEKLKEEVPRIYDSELISVW